MSNPDPGSSGEPVVWGPEYPGAVQVSPGLWVVLPKEKRNALDQLIGSVYPEVAAQEIKVKEVRKPHLLDRIRERLMRIRNICGRRS